MSMPRIPLSLLILGLGVGQAHAAGYGLREFSAVASGAAYAGSAATDSDPSFLAYNPAALAGVENADMTFSLVSLIPSAEARYTTAATAAATPAGGNALPHAFVDIAPIPNMAARLRVDERWAIGIAVTAPWGLSTHYDDDWAGRYFALKTKLITINATPTVSYQATPWLSLAAAAQIEYADGYLSTAIDLGTLGALYSVPGAVPGTQDGKGVVKVRDWAYGFVLGAMADLSEDVTVGVSFHSAIHHDFHGTLNYYLDGDGIGAFINGATGLFTDTRARARLTTPETVNVGARVRFSENWTALAELDWLNWSRFQELRVVAANPVQPDDVTTTRWHDTVFAALGAEYEASDTWTLRGGAGWDQSPVPDSTREPRVPDGDRYWLSAGASYRASDSLGITFTYSHMFIPSGDIDLDPSIPGNALRGSFAGNSNVEGNVVGIQLIYTVN